MAPILQTCNLGFARCGQRGELSSYDRKELFLRHDSHDANEKNDKEENKIIIYQTEDGQTQIDVRLENETVWLTQAQMAMLFEKTPQNITMHIGNAYKEGELP